MSPVTVWHHHPPVAGGRRLGGIFDSSARPTLHRVPGILSPRCISDLRFLPVATVLSQVTISFHRDGRIFSVPLLVTSIPVSVQAGPRALVHRDLEFKVSSPHGEPLPTFSSTRGGQNQMSSALHFGVASCPVVLNVGRWGERGTCRGLELRPRVRWTGARGTGAGRPSPGRRPGT